MVVVYTLVMLALVVLTVVGRGQPTALNWYRLMAVVAIGVIAAIGSLDCAVRRLIDRLTEETRDER